MTWFIVAVAAGILMVLLVRTMKQYEKESAAAALEQVTQLTEVTMGLEKRIQNLEAIVTAVDTDPVVSDVESDAPARESAQRSRTRT
jgi:sensor domain CHASE-containing protein